MTDVEPEAVVNTDETPDPTIESSSDDGVKNDAAAPASAKVEPSPEEIEPASDPANPASTGIIPIKSLSEKCIKSSNQANRRS